MPDNTPVELQLIRHASLRIRISGLSLLVDPMLGKTGSMPAIQNSPNPRPNPLVPLPLAIDEILKGIDAVLVTHMHRDHWDQSATDYIPRSMRIICQPEDADRFHELGFEDVRPIHTAAVFGHVGIYRTGGQHGTGEIGLRMAPVSGYVLRSRQGECLYIAGDSIFCKPVCDALLEYRPQYTVVNAGGARFLEGAPITMSAENVADVADTAPFTQVIAVHMEAINHCVITRQQLREHLDGHGGAAQRVWIPADGEVLHLCT